MQTIDKAMKLLSLFSDENPEIGLSEMARMAEMDKAGAHRLLVALQKHAFVEQNAISREYRLGIGVLSLARVREKTFPIASVVEPFLQSLNDKTEETVHASLSVGTKPHLVAVSVKQSTRSTRVHLQNNSLLPIHATASGLAFLAFSSKERLSLHVPSDLPVYTPSTIVNIEALEQELASIKERGYSSSNQEYEEEVFGVAAPFFDALSQPCGAVGIACPISRMTPEREQEFADLVVNAALDITAAMGGKVSDGFLEANKSRIK